MPGTLPVEIEVTDQFGLQIAIADAAPFTCSAATAVELAKGILDGVALAATELRDTLQEAFTAIATAGVGEDVLAALPALPNEDLL